MVLYRIDDSTSDVIAAGNTSSSSEDIPTFASQLATGKQRLLASFPLLKVFENNEHAKAMPEKFNEQSDEQSASVLPKATKNLGFDIIMGSGKRIILCIDNIEVGFAFVSFLGHFHLRKSLTPTPPHLLLPPFRYLATRRTVYRLLLDVAPFSTR